MSNHGKILHIHVLNFINIIYYLHFYDKIVKTSIVSDKGKPQVMLTLPMKYFIV